LSIITQALAQSNIQAIVQRINEIYEESNTIGRSAAMLAGIGTKK
jgi:tetrahydromethanopterin S-methyltransferase subunit F